MPLSLSSMSECALTSSSAQEDSSDPARDDGSSRFMLSSLSSGDEVPEASLSASNSGESNGGVGSLMVGSCIHWWMGLSCQAPGLSKAKAYIMLLCTKYRYNSLHLL